jgi:hypothetical protein
MKRVSLGVISLALISGTAAGAQDTTAVDTSYVEYSDRPVSLPLGIGLRVPTYDRVNGLTLPWGPKIETSNGRIDADLLVRYRSHLGNWDPSLEGVLRPGDTNELKFFLGRGTFTNDGWIRSDLMNSLAALFVGSDARNYYRSDKAVARLSRALMPGSTVLTPFIGFNYERDWSTSDLVPTSSPWSFFGRTGRLRMRRGNPPVDRGHIASFLVGTGVELAKGDLESKLNFELERSIHTDFDQFCVATPGGLVCLQNGGNFTQGTGHATLRFPTFGTQTFTFTGHGVFTGGSTVSQRFAYLGGAGTLATVDLLALGGDGLLFLQGDYMIPLERIKLPYVGSPFIALRYAAGTAGSNSLPPLIQNVGVGVGVSFLRVDFTIDPAHNRSPFSHRSAVTFGADLAF